MVTTLTSSSTRNTGTPYLTAGDGAGRPGSGAAPVASSAISDVATATTASSATNQPADATTPANRGRGVGFAGRERRVVTRPW